MDDGDDAAVPAGEPPRAGARELEVEREGRWFRVVAGPEPVRLEQRPTLRRVLAALLARRLAAPGAVLTVEQLFEAGWPGERARFDAQRNRVYAAVKALRQAGLGAALTRDGEGYLLDPSVALRAVD